LKKVAKEFPNVRFTLIDGVVKLPTCFGAVQGA